METLQIIRFKSQIFQIAYHLVVHQQAHHHGLTQLGGEGRYADIEAAHLALIFDTAVVGNVGVGDIHVGHDFKARGQSLLKAFGKQIGLVQNSVDAVVDAHQVAVRDNVDIAGAQHIALVDEQARQSDDLVFF